MRASIRFARSVPAHGKRVQVEDESRFPTVVEGFVEGGRLRVRVHNVLRNSVAGEFSYAPRCIDS